MILVLADRHSVVGKVQSSHSAAGTAVHILSVWTESDFGIIQFTIDFIDDTLVACDMVN